MTDKRHQHWKTCRIEEIKSDERSSIAIGPFGSRMKAECYVPTGVPVIRGLNISDTKSFTGEFVFISEATAGELSGCIVREADLVFPHRGSIGQVGIVTGDKSTRYMLSSSLMKLTCNTAVADPLFLFYYFRSATGRNELLKHSSQVGTPGIATPLATLRSLEVPVPPIQRQKEISALLGALDDLIDCNRRTNGILEAMARALFKHWFVDFGPFKKQGFQNSELGPIPKAWAAKPILDCCSLLSGGTPSTSVADYWNGEIPWASARDVSQCGTTYLLDTARKITPLGVESSATQVLPQGTVVIIARGATTGKFAALGRDMAMNQTCYGLRGKPGFSQEWVYLMLAQVVPQLQQAAHGTIFDTITTTTFQTTNIVVPTQPVLDELTEKVKPLFEQIHVNLRENQILARTRDYLLPKLLSGEVEVKEAKP